MGLAWFAASFALGILVGVALRSLTARRQVARVRAEATAPAAGGASAGLHARVTELEEEVSVLRAEAARQLDVARATSETSGTIGADPAPAAPAPAPDPVDPLGGAASTSAAVPTDDLVRIVGIAPHVADLCHGIGIHTFEDLAATEVSLLRTMLDDAGPRSRVHDPATWPEQARLLAEGRVGEFEVLAASLREARVAERVEDGV